jgi:DnaJ-class molecular chaperone
MTPVQARKVLGLGDSYTESELKSQYRKKVLISHPDRNNGDDSRFILVQNAFEILSSNHTITATTNQQKTRDVYQARRKADEQYKEKVKYYYRQKKKSEKQINKEILQDFSENIKYFFFTILLLISFLIVLVISMCFGLVGVITLLIIITVVYHRYDFTKFKI